MNISEVESRAGLPRATIRYYEKQGLLSPQREENGYRDYTVENVNELDRIRLMRMLDCSVEEIRDLQRNTADLGTVLKQKTDELRRLRTEEEKKIAICDRIIASGCAYDALDANTYLHEPQTEKIAPAPASDREEPHPWLRLLARWLDLNICSCIWSAVLLLGFRYNVNRHDGAGRTLVLFANWAVPMIIMYVVEPVLLHITGTTPGKWILGFRVQDVTGQKPEYRTAREYTKRAITYGWGWSIPILCWFLMWKSRKTLLETGGCEWEGPLYSVCTDTHTHTWRRILYAAVLVLILFAEPTFDRCAKMPPNRGNITVEQFVENRHCLIRYYGQKSVFDLNRNGEYTRIDGVDEPYVPDDAMRPEFFPEEKDGFLSGFTLVFELDADPLARGGEYWRDVLQTEMEVCTLAFAGSGEGETLANEIEPITYVNDHPATISYRSKLGLDLEYTVTTEGVSTSNYILGIYTSEGRIPRTVRIQLGVTRPEED